MRRIVTLIALLLIASGAVYAEKQKISIGFSYGSFKPMDSATRGKFGSSFSRVGFTSFDPAKPTAGRFIAEVGNYRLSDVSTNVRLTPVTVGVERGLSKSTTMLPYVTLRAGPYFGKAEDETTGLNESRVGLNVNATFGVVLKKWIYAEARYDYFSSLAHNNFSGLSLSVGVKLFDVRF
jgi:hypothetical protein